MSRILLVATLFAIGCAPSEPCGGPPPSIESCQVGVPFADCGGTDAPRYACSFPTCRWFTGGCVAAGYVVRGCPPLDAYSFAEAWGGDAWDATRERSVDVVIAPAGGDARPTATCVGRAFEYGCPDPSAGALVVRHAGSRAATFVVGFMRSIGGNEVSVELLTDEDGSRHARVCSVPYTDGPLSGACATGRGRGRCAVRGTVTIGAVPTTPAEVESAALDVSATFEDGSTVELRL